MAPPESEAASASSGTQAAALAPLALALLLAIGVTGCAGPPGGPGTAADLTMAEPREEPPAASADPLALAGQIDRDVQQFLQQRAAASEPPPSSGPPAIQWNDPPPRQEPSSPATVESEQPEPVSQAALARPEDLAPPPVEWSGDVDETSDEQADTVPEDAADTAGTAGDALELLLVDLCRELYQEAAYADMPLRQLLLIAATTMVTPDRRLAPDAVPGLTDRERVLLEEFQNFFSQLGQRLDESTAPDETEQAIDEALLALRQALSTEPQLGLPTAVLGTRVDGFGDFDEFPRNADDRYVFLAHSERRVIVYLEVDQFTSELNADGQWVTELSQELRIYSDRDGMPVWSEQWQTAADVSRNKRHDFFTVQVITLPRELSVGRYQLKVRVRDERSGAEAETAIGFEMVADPKMAISAR